MSVAMPQTETALGDCRDFLSVVRAAVPLLDPAPIEAYLARHIVVLLCNEVESLIASYLNEMVDAAGCTPPVANLLKSVKRPVRSIRNDDIAEMLGALGLNYKATFKAEVQQLIGDAGSSRMGSAAVARDDAAHRSPPAVTLAELELTTQAALGSLQAVRTTLGLP